MVRSMLPFPGLAQPVLPVLDLPILRISPTDANRGLERGLQVCQPKGIFWSRV